MSTPKSFRQTIGLGPSTVDLKSAALLVIDAQGSYATGAPLAITGVEASLGVISSTVDKFRSAGAPVYFVQHSAGSGAPIFNPDNESYALIGGLKAGSADKVLVKAAPSCFTGTDLDATLKAQGIKQIVLTGYMAHVCVSGTARDGMEHGYDVILVADAIGDRDVPSVDGKSVVKAEFLVGAVLAELGDAIGTVIQSSEIAA